MTAAELTQYRYQVAACVLIVLCVGALMWAIRRHDRRLGR